LPEFKRNVSGSSTVIVIVMMVRQRRFIELFLFRKAQISVEIKQ
jgi:hypothetical protein